MKSCELASFITATACALAKEFDSNQLSILAAVFTQLGDTLATILTVEEACQSDQSMPLKDT